MEELRWKDIEGYEGLYEICEDGRIKNKKSGELLNGTKSNNGYIRISLSKCSKSKKIYKHRLLAIAFIEKVDGKNVVNHINGLKDDNRLENLEWTSIRENTSHGFIGKGSSKYNGVAWHKATNKWRGRLLINNINYWLGTYNSEEAAYAAVLKFQEENNIINKYA